MSQMEKYIAQCAEFFSECGVNVLMLVTADTIRHKKTTDRYLGAHFVVVTVETFARLKVSLQEKDLYATYRDKFYIMKFLPSENHIELVQCPNWVGDYGHQYLNDLHHAIHHTCVAMESVEYEANQIPKASFFVRYQYINEEHYDILCSVSFYSYKDRCASDIWKQKFSYQEFNKLYVFIAVLLDGKFFIPPKWELTQSDLTYPHLAGFLQENSHIATIKSYVYFKDGK